jgi:hypothetical protein
MIRDDRMMDAAQRYRCPLKSGCCIGGREERTDEQVWFNVKILGESK